MIKSEKGFIYIIAAEDTNLYKIGVTRKSPEKRLKQLQTGNPIKLIIIHTLESNNYNLLESTLHRSLKQYNTVGEWFEIPNISIVIDELIKLDENLTFLKENTTLKKLCC